MESIGVKLRTAREEMGRSIEEVARETNIAKRYIIALESEDFDVFPGEPYLIGFLRTYAETLGLSADEMVALYKNFKIQEQPLPMDELIQKPNRRILWIILILIIIAGGLGAGAYFLIPKIQERVSLRKTERTEQKKAVSAGTVYEMKDEIVERRFSEGDTIRIPLDSKEYDITLSKIEKDLTLSTPRGKLVLKVGEERNLDLNEDSKDDIKVFVRDIDLGGSENTVIMRFDKFTQASISATDQSEKQPETAAIFNSGSQGRAGENGNAADESVPEIGSASVDSRKQKPITILEASESQPITLDMIFRGYCLLRSMTDGANREERYFHKGETFRIEAMNTIRLWISNAGAFKAKISGVDVDMGRPGEVATKLIEWTRYEDTGKWELRILPVY